MGRGGISHAEEDFVKPFGDRTAYLGEIEEISSGLENSFEVVGDGITTNEKIELFISIGKSRI